MGTMSVLSGPSVIDSCLMFLAIMVIKRQLIPYLQVPNYVLLLSVFLLV